MPAVNAPIEPLSEVIKFRVTPTEKANMKALAKEARITMTDFIRKSCHDVKVVVSTRVDFDGVEKICRAASALDKMEAEGHIDQVKVDGIIDDMAAYVKSLKVL